MPIPTLNDVSHLALQIRSAQRRRSLAAIRCIRCERGLALPFEGMQCSARATVARLRTAALALTADGVSYGLRAANHVAALVRRVRKDVQPCEFRQALCCEATMTYAVRTTGHAGTVSELPLCVVVLGYK